MRKIFVGFVLALMLSFGTASAENWVYFSDSDNGDWYADLDSVRGDGVRFTVAIALMSNSADTRYWYKREVSIIPSVGQFKYLSYKKHTIGITHYDEWYGDDYFSNYTSGHIMYSLGDLITGSRKEKGFSSLEPLINPVKRIAYNNQNTYPGNWLAMESKNFWFYDANSIVDKGNGKYEIMSVYLGDDTKILWVNYNIVDINQNLINNYRTDYLNTRERTHYLRERGNEFVSNKSDSINQQLVNIVKTGSYKGQKGYSTLLEPQNDEPVKEKKKKK